MNSIDSGGKGKKELLIRRLPLKLIRLASIKDKLKIYSSKPTTGPGQSTSWKTIPIKTMRNETMKSGTSHLHVK